MVTLNNDRSMPVCDLSNIIKQTSPRGLLLEQAPSVREIVINIYLNLWDIDMIFLYLRIFVFPKCDLSFSGHSHSHMKFHRYKYSNAALRLRVRELRNIEPGLTVNKGIIWISHNLADVTCTKLCTNLQNPIYLPLYSLKCPQPKAGHPPRARIRVAS